MLNLLNYDIRRSNSITFFSIFQYFYLQYGIFYGIILALTITLVHCFKDGTVIMINIALLGFGNIGGGTAEVLTENNAQIERYVGCPVKIKYILDLREFPNSPFGKLIVHDFNIILNDPDVKIVAEMMGGSHPAYDFTKACLEAGKSVVTSNKEVVAKFGAELLDIAAKNGVRYLFEASVGGGIPIIRPMINDLAANGIIAVSGILNGTTNYILTRMDREGADLPTILRDAQALGYAEANPAADIDGIDAARKIVILAALAFGKVSCPEDIHTEGIGSITLADIKTAALFGCSVKLIAHTELVGGRMLIMVSPRFVHCDSPMYGVADAFNSILVEGDMIGCAMFYGRGAGRLPTASAVTSDIIDIAANIKTAPRKLHWDIAKREDLADFSAYCCRSCFIFEDTAGCDTKLEKAFGKFEKTVRANGRIAFIPDAMTEKEANEKAAACGVPFVKRFRIL